MDDSMTRFLQVVPCSHQINISSSHHINIYLGLIISIYPGLMISIYLGLIISIHIQVRANLKTFVPEEENNDR